MVIDSVENSKALLLLQCPNQWWMLWFGIQSRSNWSGLDRATRGLVELREPAAQSQQRRINRLESPNWIEVWPQLQLYNSHLAIFLLVSSVTMMHYVQLSRMQGQPKHISIQDINWLQSSVFCNRKGQLRPLVFFQTPKKYMLPVFSLPERKVVNQNFETSMTRAYGDGTTKRKIQLFVLKYTPILNGIDARHRYAYIIKHNNISHNYRCSIVEFRVLSKSPPSFFTF